MDWGITVGCFLLLFAPYLIAFVKIERWSPQLITIVLSGACAGILSLVITTVLMKGLKWVCGATSWTPGLAGVVIFTQVGIQFTLKGVVIWSWVWVQERLRRERQVLVSCKCRFAPVSGALGLGFAMVSTWSTGGVLFDAYRQLSHFSPYAAAYDLDVCPQLPMLVHSSFQCAMLTLCHVSWGIMAGQPFVALAQYGVRAYLGGLRRRLRPFYVPMREVNIVDIRSGSDDSAPEAKQSDETIGNGGPNLGTESLMSAVATNDTKRKSIPEGLETDFQSLTREEIEGASRGLEKSPEQVPKVKPREDAEGHSLSVEPKEAPATASDAATTTNIFEGPLYRYDGVIPADTIFLLHLDFALLSLVFAFTLQVIFSMISISHSGALDVATYVEVPTRGCVVSLPIQIVVLTVSVLWALWTLREEMMNID
ncbi:unnamed protein product [Phytomonas sp. Hart1]|nr:unnamed protein product [Phytomonas sp. Hart1]|eukprot:CCW66659.1 unnamed protein product [Phytomonas sp. isolate Hart1]